MRFSRSKRSPSPAKKSRPKAQLKGFRPSPTHDMVVVPTPARLTINYRPIHRLRLNPDNPRLHTEKQVKQIARSVQTFGFNVPVLVDGNLQVVAGHGRLQAARFLGMVEVPTVSLEHLTDAQAKAFTIADNRLTENSIWDDRLLAEQLKSLSEVELDFSLDVTGFEIAEVDLLIEGLTSPPGSQSDPADVLPETKTMVQVSCPGDLWILGRNRMYCGDARCPGSYKILMEDRRASAVFSDPPYNVPIDGHAVGLGAIHHRNFAMAAGEMSPPEFTDFLTSVCQQLAAHSQDGSIHFLCMDWRHMGELLAAGRQVYDELKNLCVWAKNNAGMGSLYRSQHELVFVFKNGKQGHRNNVQLGKYGRYRTNVWNYPGANSFSRSTQEGNLLELHPTVKPVALVADAIMDCSARGDIVLDPFLGSGTTVIAAEQTGRVCYGIELDPTYIDTIVRRWQSFTGLSAIHAVSGRTFNELEEEAAREQRP
jgi:DNA modification methylase